MPLPFRDRKQAGELLAEPLKAHTDRSGALVLALPRGGVPVAFEVARLLHLPLDVCTVRKLGVPGQEELAMGAIASGGVCALNREVIDSMAIPPGDIEAAIENERRELARRERTYRGDRPFPDLRGRVVLLVDDGLATGSTMLAAVAALRAGEPARIVVAVPVASRQARELLEREAGEVVVLEVPSPFQSVGNWYGNFSQTTDAEILDLLHRAAAETRR